MNAVFMLYISNRSLLSKNEMLCNQEFAEGEVIGYYYVTLMHQIVLDAVHARGAV